MKSRTRHLLIYLAIGMSVAIFTAYFIYQYRKNIWYECTTKAFVEILEDNLKERGIKNASMYKWEVCNGQGRSFYIGKDSFINVTMISEIGRKIYKIPLYKYEYNIENSNDVRFMHSFILHNNPLNPDSLNNNWSDELSKINFDGKSMICVSVTDLYEKESRYFSNNASLLKKGDSIFHIYLGFRSEVEIAGYIYIPWWRTFDLQDTLFLCGIVLFSLLLPLLMKYMSDFYKKYLPKKEVATIEKESHVIVADKSTSHIYQLDDGVLFDFESHTISIGAKLEQLTTQQADLLQMFLEADNYLLTTNKIADTLWPSSIDAKNNIYSAIKRLRISLSHISQCKIENRDTKYQLIIPHSIEKKK